MKLARRWIALILLWAILPSGAARAGAEGDAALPPLMYFFENYCDACHPETEFIENFHSLTGRHLSEYSYSYYNVRYADNRALFDAVAEEYGIAPENRFLPMVVVNGTVYAGNSRVEAALPMDFLENESTDSVIYYL